MPQASRPEQVPYTPVWVLYPALADHTASMTLPLQVSTSSLTSETALRMALRAEEGIWSTGVYTSALAEEPYFLWYSR